MTSPTVELAGELADGMMPFMWSAERVARSKVWAARGRAKAPGRAPLDIAHGIPTFIGDDIAAMREAARANLACSPPSHSISGCSAPAALPRRQQRRKRVPAAPRSATGCSMRFV